MHPSFRWRLMEPSDLAAVAQIAAQAHPAFPEDDAVFAERQRLYPDGVRLLERDGQPAGYVVSHPWRSGAPPALNAALHAIPADADTFYLHDLALAPVARGAGAAAWIVEALAALALGAGFASMSLIAVNGSVPFWRRLGFIEQPSDGLTEKLNSYEAAARLMVRGLG